MRSRPPSRRTLCSFLPIMSKHLACECLLKMGSLNPPQEIGILPTSPRPVTPASIAQLLPQSSLYPTPRTATKSHGINRPGPRDAPCPSLTTVTQQAQEMCYWFFFPLPKGALTLRGSPCFPPRKQPQDTQIADQDTSWCQESEISSHGTVPPPPRVGEGAPHKPGAIFQRVIN